MSRTTEEKAEAFRALHAGEPFVITNPWDAGSARVLAALGFPALATTSSGFAFTLGRLDGTATLAEVGAHVAALARATDLPLSVDLEHGYGADPGLAVKRVGEADAVGASIEDWDGARLQAFERAGADVFYAPGCAAGTRSGPCQATSKPLNALAHRGLSMREITAAGGRRVSVGGALTWVAVGALAQAATRIRDDGDFSALAARADPGVARRLSSTTLRSRCIRRRPAYGPSRLLRRRESRGVPCSCRDAGCRRAASLCRRTRCP